MPKYKVKKACFCGNTYRVPGDPRHDPYITDEPIDPLPSYLELIEDDIPTAPAPGPGPLPEGEGSQPTQPTQPTQPVSGDNVAPRKEDDKPDFMGDKVDEGKTNTDTGVTTLDA